MGTFGRERPLTTIQNTGINFKMVETSTITYNGKQWKDEYSRSEWPYYWPWAKRIYKLRFRNVVVGQGFHERNISAFLQHKRAWP